MTALQLLPAARSGFNGQLEGARTTMITARILVASVALARVSYAAWSLIEGLLGRP